jgi:hypothetical protein
MLHLLVQVRELQAAGEVVAMVCDSLYMIALQLHTL